MRMLWVATLIRTDSPHDFGPSPASSARRSSVAAAPVWNRRIPDDVAVAHLDDAPGIARNVGLVGHDQHGDALVVELLEESHDLDRCSAIEIAGGLVGQEQRWLGHECAGDGDTLLLTARELAWLMVGPFRQTDSRQRPRRECTCIEISAGAIVEQRQLDVFESGSAREEIEALEDEAELLIAQIGKLCCCPNRSRVRHRGSTRRWSAHRGNPAGSSAWTSPIPTHP